MKKIFFIAVLFCIGKVSFGQQAPDTCHCNKLIKWRIIYNDSIKVSSFKSKFPTYDSYVQSKLGNCKVSLFSVDAYYVQGRCTQAYHTDFSFDSLKYIWNASSADALVSFINSEGLEVPNCFQCKSNTAINNNTSSGFLSVYPNPSKGIFILEFSQPISSSQLVIYNTLGESLLSVTLMKSATKQYIDLSNYTNGIYFLRVNENTYKIIIE